MNPYEKFITWKRNLALMKCPYCDQPANPWTHHCSGLDEAVKNWPDNPIFTHEPGQYEGMTVERKGS